MEGFLGEKESKEKHNVRDMLIESARITRNNKQLRDLSTIKVDSYKALILPSFVHAYDRELVLNTVYNVASIRSTIMEFNAKSKFIVAIGPSSINLVAKILGIQDKIQSYPQITQQSNFKFKYYQDAKVLYLPYDPLKVDKSNETDV